MKQKSKTGCDLLNETQVSEFNDHWDFETPEVERPANETQRLKAITK
jgi:hypothetical protein